MGTIPKARAEDLNNFHFGVVGKAYNVFPERFMLKVAGYEEMRKWEREYNKGLRNSPEVPEAWRPIEFIAHNPGPFGGIFFGLGYPYGDNPTDSRWIMRGFDYYKTHF